MFWSYVTKPVYESSPRKHSRKFSMFFFSKFLKISTCTWWIDWQTDGHIPLRGFKNRIAFLQIQVVCDGRTDGWMDTLSNRDARTHLKAKRLKSFWNFFLPFESNGWKKNPMKGLYQWQPSLAWWRNMPTAFQAVFPAFLRWQKVYR